MKNNLAPKEKFSSYQILVVVLLAVAQFTVVLDFMVMAPLGDILMKSMKLNAPQFATAVSAYAFAAGVSGIFAAGFADRFDRKKLLLFLYTGFIVGTLLVALSGTHFMLMFARIVTGLFGGVISAVTLAIITDIFSFQQRGRVMGFVQMAFAVSQVAGIPIGLYLANIFSWHAPFLLIVGISVVTAVIIGIFLRPVAAHIQHKREINAFVHLKNTVVRKQYVYAFATTALLSIGGYMMMPFSTPFLINNVGILNEQLPGIYVVMGVCSMIVMPTVGRISDKAGKFPTFVFGTVLGAVMVFIYCNLPVSPVWKVIVVSATMFAGIMSRMIPAQALMTAVPDSADRGAFMSVNSSLQQIAGGIASVIAGLIVYQEPGGRIHHFDTLGYICIVMMIIGAFLMSGINKIVMDKVGSTKAVV